MADDADIADNPGPATEAPLPLAPAAEDAFIVDEATDEVLRLHLDNFEGPFEVLLYLIKSQEIDIFDIPILKITDQYLRFLELLREEDLDIAGDFLVMAATLIQIKSKMLLPADLDMDEEEIEEEDPRLELVEKLLEYRRYRAVTERMDALQAERARWFTRAVKPEIEEVEEEYTEVSLYDLIQAFRGVLRFITDGRAHTVAGEGHSIDEKIEWIQELLAERKSIAWTEIFKDCKSRLELICCFLAILELCRMDRVRARQQRTFGDIRLFAVTPARRPDVVPA